MTLSNFTTTIRLPPHRFKVDEEKFLRLVAGCVTLYTHEKRHIIQIFDKIKQREVDELISVFENELKAQEAWNLKRPGRREGYEREREKHIREWREMEGEMGD